MSGLKSHSLKFYVAILAICFAVVFLVGLFILEFYVPVSPFKTTQTIRVEIPSGSGTIKVSKTLRSQELIRSDKFFCIAARFPLIFGRTTPYLIKSGVYSISSSMSICQILNLLDSGEQEYIKTVFPEGLTISKIAQMLEENGVCKAEDFKNACHDESILSEYGIFGDTIEGFLFPDTYFFTPSMEPKSVITMMVKNFFEKTAEIPNFSQKTEKERYDIIILASIVEREYRVASEAPLIASVFYNRLEDNVGFYSCATIEYIITEIQGKPHPDVITYDDLQIDSPYNTYKWAGLTPTPISNPGLVALKAATNPAVTDYYYFTLTDEQKGIHTFTKSFSSHTRAGLQYKTKKAASGN